MPACKIYVKVKDDFFYENEMYLRDLPLLIGIIKYSDAHSGCNVLNSCPRNSIFMCTTRSTVWKNGKFAVTQNCVKAENMDIS